MSENSDEKKKTPVAESREDRLKAALRANLRRRKAAARKSRANDTGSGQT